MVFSADDAGHQAAHWNAAAVDSWPGVIPRADAYVDMTQLGIEKGHHFNCNQEDMGAAAKAVVEAFSGPRCNSGQ